jgi:RNA polymerase sigma factor (sigma-70 family)
MSAAPYGVPNRVSWCVPCLREKAAPLPPPEVTLQVAHQIARRLGAGDDTAEDLAQEALLRMLSSRAPVRSPVAWLARVLPRLAWRSQGRRARLRSVATEGLDRRDPQWGPATELRLLLSMMLTHLGARDRQLILMFIAGFKQREIAEALGCKTRDVGTMQKRALEKIRAQLE